MKNIGIIGCGWLGLHLAEHLSGFYQIYTTTRSEGKKEQLSSKGFEVSVIDFSTEVEKVWRCYYNALKTSVNSSKVMTSGYS
jgi:Trk K+ transport system NAD-binding subunit